MGNEVCNRAQMALALGKKLLSGTFEEKVSVVHQNLYLTKTYQFSITLTRCVQCDLCDMTNIKHTLICIALFVLTSSPCEQCHLSSYFLQARFTFWSNNFRIKCTYKCMTKASLMAWSDRESDPRVLPMRITNTNWSDWVNLTDRKILCFHNSML